MTSWASARTEWGEYNRGLGAGPPAGAAILPGRRRYGSMHHGQTCPASRHPGHRRTRAGRGRRRRGCDGRPGAGGPARDRHRRQPRGRGAVRHGMVRRGLSPARRGHRGAMVGGRRRPDRRRRGAVPAGRPGTPPADRGADLAELPADAVRNRDGGPALRGRRGGQRLQGARYAQDAARSEGGAEIRNRLRRRDEPSPRTV